MRPAASSTGRTPRPRIAEVEREQPEGECRAQHLDHEHGPGNPVVERGHAHGLHVDHLVQRLDVHPRRAVDGPVGERVAGEAPELALDLVAVGYGRPCAALPGIAFDSRMLVSV